jgi:endonuclease/exonuclease/phosphatase (EEP) superfamily protein YafD
MRKSSTNLECLLVRIHLFDSQPVVGIFYRAPNVPFTPFAEEFETIASNVAESNQLILMGDFNLDPVGSASSFRRFDAMIRAFGLTTVDFSPTRITETTSTTLDRFIVKDMDKVRALAVHSVSSIADHELVILDMAYTQPLEEPVVRYFRDWQRVNVPALLNEIQNQDWSSVYLTASSDDKVSN